MNAEQSPLTKYIEEIEALREKCLKLSANDHSKRIRPKAIAMGCTPICNNDGVVLGYANPIDPRTCSGWGTISRTFAVRTDANIEEIEASIESLRQSVLDEFRQRKCSLLPQEYHYQKGTQKRIKSSTIKRWQRSLEVYELVTKHGKKWAFITREIGSNKGTKATAQDNAEKELKEDYRIACRLIEAAENDKFPPLD